MTHTRVRFYKRVVSPLLHALDSEKMHDRARRSLGIAGNVPFGVGRRLLSLYACRDPRLRVTVAGITFENPVLVGAGWDKKGEAIAGLHALGFAGVEVGTVPEHPQPGNAMPRQFMVADGVAVNRLGFNSPGMATVAAHLDRQRGHGVPVGISVGINRTVLEAEAPQAHARVVRRLYAYGAFFVINVSSPNTPGLRGLQGKEPLTAIVRAVQAAMAACGGQKPLFVKIAPDLDTTAIDDVLDVAQHTGIAGIIATNTTIAPALKGKYPVTDRRLVRRDPAGMPRTWADEAGGLSGDDADYRARTTEIVRYLYREGRRRGLPLVIIGVGGIHDAATALEKIKAGATLVQVVTAIRGEGPGVAGAINRGIVAEMRRLGLTHYAALVGYDVPAETGERDGAAPGGAE